MPEINKDIIDIHRTRDTLDREEEMKRMSVFYIGGEENMLYSFSLRKTNTMTKIRYADLLSLSPTLFNHLQTHRSNCESYSVIKTLDG